MPAPISDRLHLWLRAEPRQSERRTPLLPESIRALKTQGAEVTVEDSPRRIIPTAAYRDAGARIVPEATWPNAPGDAVILGLKELPDDGTPLRHTHIMFGHAFKGQHAGARLLDRFRTGGGTLLDLEYLTDGEGRRVAAFGYWAGYVGAAVSLLAWGAQLRGGLCPSVTEWSSSPAMLADLQEALVPLTPQRPTALVVGAKGRVGRGAADLCTAMGVPVTGWDMEETAHGGPFPEILAHGIFLNCILARPGTPVFTGPAVKTASRTLGVIGDIACDPDIDYNPVPLYEEATSWDAPALRVHDKPPLDIMAIDNLPSLLPAESSNDFAEQLLPHLMSFGSEVWERARYEFTQRISGPRP